jgi:hypothetical protein
VRFQLHAEFAGEVVIGADNEDQQFVAPLLLVEIACNDDLTGGDTLQPLCDCLQVVGVVIDPVDKNYIL